MLDGWRGVFLAVDVPWLELTGLHRENRCIMCVHLLSWQISEQLNCQRDGGGLNTKRFF